MNNVDKEIKVLDGMVFDDEYLADRRRIRDEEKKYKLAKKQNIYKKVIGKMNQIKKTSIPIFLAGCTVFSSAILLAGSYKWNMDDKLYEQLHSPLKYYSYEVPKDDEISSEHFKFGTSPDVDKINVVMNNSSVGYFVNKFCEFYGVDSNVMASVMNYEGILSDSLSRDVIEHRVEKFNYNMNCIYEILKDKYSHVSMEQLNSAVLLCSMESDHIGLDFMVRVINESKIFNSDNNFDYSEFKKAISNLKLDNKDEKYIDKIFGGVSSPKLRFVIDGEEVNYSLKNDVNHLNSGGRIL